MSTNSVSLHRVFHCPPEKLYRALTEPDALASWLPPFGFVCTVHEMKAEPGGTYRMSFRNFSTGKSQFFGGEYLELKPNEYLRYTDKFEDPNLPGEMTNTIWLKSVSVGTDLKILQEGIPSMIPAEACYLGWQESLEKLTRLVGPEIPDTI